MAISKNVIFLNTWAQNDFVQREEAAVVGAYSPGTVVKIQYTAGDDKGKFVQCGADTDAKERTFVLDVYPGEGQVPSTAYAADDPSIAVPTLPGYQMNVRTGLSGTVSKGTKLMIGASGRLLAATSGKEIVAETSEDLTGVTAGDLVAVTFSARGATA